MSSLSRCLLLVVLLTACRSGSLPAQEEAGPVAKSDLRRQELYRREAAGYEFTVAGSHRDMLEFRAEPVMRWVSLNDYDGNVFVWTRGGRPEVIGTIFSFTGSTAGQRNVMQEFHSLSQESVEGLGEGGFSFSLTPPVELKAVASAAAPAEGAAALRLQSRAIARSFSARMQTETERWQLRLLNQPLYAYGEADGGVLGGAVFAFVGFVTDPEVLLLVEARETADGPRWFYAPARFSNKSLWLERKGEEVWQYLADDASPAKAPYHLVSPKAVAVPETE